MRFLTYLPVLAGLALAAGACERSADARAEYAARVAAGRPAWIDAPVPEEHRQGEALFAASCARCHGPAASGSRMGPPLVHIVYEPNHHADAAFFLAVARGVRAHHWRFGNMPRIPGVTEEDVARIVGYVRWLQREAGIY